MKIPERDIAILGAGPCGLGAAWRLHELGHERWRIFEKSDHPGGLAASFLDSRGFTWDIGGHVQFSHFDLFDRVMLAAHPPDAWIHHDREAWIWMRKRFIPYPLQNNIGLLPPEEMRECLEGLEKARNAPPPAAGFANFAHWVDCTAGPGLRRHFMEPYNRKVWAYPLEDLDAEWVGDRVAVPQLDRIRENIATGRIDCSWGPNNRFRFPLRGATGSIWRNVAALLPRDRFHYNAEVIAVDLDAKRLRFADGREEPYDVLISSLPLNHLLRLAGGREEDVRALVFSSANIIGIGLRGRPPEKLRAKCWMYFPESDCPFYRVTVFSNYSPNNVPPGDYWSLMAEVSESPKKPVDHAALLDQVIDGLRATQLISPDDEIVSTWQYRASPGYPTPFLGRDKIIDPLLADLRRRGVYSRGRFGAWKYEVSNQDHTFMQGVEAVDHALFGVPELTIHHPNLVNSKRVR